MKELKWAKLEKSLVKFLKKLNNESYNILELTLDTSAAKKALESPSLYLIFCAYEVQKDFNTFMQKEKNSAAMNLFRDNIADSSDQLWFELTLIDEQLATAEKFLAAKGEVHIANALASFIKIHPDSFTQFSNIFLHWVDDTEFIIIKNEEHINF